MQKKMWIAALGDNCIDIYDETGEYYVGGNPVNVASYIQRLGGESAYVGAVGDDAYGVLVREKLEERGVDVSHVHVLPGRTAVTHVLLENGDRRFGEYEKGVLKDFALDEEDLEFICGHAMAVSGIYGYMEAEILKLRDRDRDLQIAFDFSDELQDPAVEAVLPYVDYAFFSLEEKEEGKAEAFLKKMKALCGGLVIVTMGSAGSMAYDGNDFIKCGIVPCRVVDTMGAGDSFIAGFLYARLQGSSVLESMKSGAQNSSVTLQYKGA